jgi:polyhydroxyalkanoate synthesis regulator protein
MELFQQTFSMFKPFVPSPSTGAAGAEPESLPAEPVDETASIEDLRRQMKDMQERLERMSSVPKKEE